MIIVPMAGNNQFDGFIGIDSQRLKIIESRITTIILVDT